MGLFGKSSKKEEKEQPDVFPQDKLCELCGKPATNGIAPPSSADGGLQMRYFCKECTFSGEAAKALNKEKSVANGKRTIEQLYQEALKEPNPYLLKDVAYPSEYPVFKFFPNPLRTTSVVESSAPCACCGKSGKHSYVAAFYRKDIDADDVENLCLDCIASGEAAKKFDGAFTEYSSIANRTADKAVTEEIMYRTPSFNTWQEPEWLSHCKTPCRYIGQVYIGDLLKLGIYKQVRTELAKTFYYQQMPMTVSEIDDMLLQMVEDSSLEGHLFQCAVCGKYRLHTDID